MRTQRRKTARGPRWDAHAALLARASLPTAAFSLRAAAGAAPLPTNSRRSSFRRVLPEGRECPAAPQHPGQSPLGLIGGAGLHRAPMTPCPGVGQHADEAVDFRGALAPRTEDQAAHGGRKSGVCFPLARWIRRVSCRTSCPGCALCPHTPLGESTHDGRLPHMSPWTSGTSWTCNAAS